MDNQQAAGIMQRAHETLRVADAALEAAAQREVADPLPVRQRPLERPASQPALGRRNWEKERAWIEQIVDQRIGKTAREWAEGVGEALGKFGKAEREQVAARHAELAARLAAAEARLADQLAKSDAAITELLMDQEQRIAAIERRFNKPRLLAGGGSDAA